MVVVIFLYQRLVYKGFFQKIKIITFETFVFYFYLLKLVFWALSFMFLTELMGKDNS